MDYRLTDKNKNYNLQKILFIFAVFLVLFFLNTTNVSAIGWGGGGGSSSTDPDSETRPSNEFGNGIKSAAWVPISACVRTIS